MNELVNNIMEKFSTDVEQLVEKPIEETVAPDAYQAAYSEAALVVFKEAMNASIHAGLGALINLIKYQMNDEKVEEERANSFTIQEMMEW